MIRISAASSAAGRYHCPLKRTRMKAIAPSPIVEVVGREVQIEMITLQNRVLSPAHGDLESGEIADLVAMVRQPGVRIEEVPDACAKSREIHDGVEQAKLAAARLETRGLSCERA